VSRDSTSISPAVVGTTYMASADEHRYLPVLWTCFPPVRSWSSLHDSAKTLFPPAIFRLEVSNTFLLPAAEVALAYKGSPCAFACGCLRSS
jgi:hypothetical protein